MKHIILSLSVILFANLSFGQFDNMFASDGIRSTWYNPASAGTFNTFSVLAQANRLSLTETVALNQLNVETNLKCLAFGNGHKGALGFQFHLNDQDILRSQTAKIVANTQFQIKNTYLSVGVSPGLQVLTLTEDLIFFGDPDVIAPTNEAQGSVDFGIQWFGQKFSVGIASQRLNEPSFIEIPVDFKRVFYAYAEYAFAIGENWNVRPRVSGRTVDSFNSIEAMVFVNNNSLPVTLGVGLRDRDVFVTGIYGRYDAFSLGYFLSVSNSALSNTSNFVHELRLSYALPDGELNTLFGGERGILSF